MSDICAGCDGEIPRSGPGEPDAFGTVWCRSEFGLTTLRVHRSTACGRAALERTGYEMLPGNKSPSVVREERKAAAKAAEG